MATNRKNPRPFQPIGRRFDEQWHASGEAPAD
jgi:hypothetical protein